MRLRDFVPVEELPRPTSTPAAQPPPEHEPAPAPELPPAQIAAAVLAEPVDRWETRTSLFGDLDC